MEKMEKTGEEERGQKLKAIGFFGFFFFATTSRRSDRKLSSWAVLSFRMINGPLWDKQCPLNEKYDYYLLICLALSD